MAFGLVPIYPLYALLFLDTGLSATQISALFALWSVTGLVTEVPAGALADRWSRRGVLVLGAVLQAAGVAVWTAAPGLPGFAAGFVLWGLSGALVSGAAEALVYDGLADVGAADSYARVNGRMVAAENLVTVPTAAAASALFAVGGYPLVGWVSVGSCLVAALVARRFPEPPRSGSQAGLAEPGLSLAGTLRAGIVAVVRSPILRLTVVAAALLGGLDAVEEYFPVMADQWGVPTAAVPIAVLAMPLAAVLGAAVGGRSRALSTRALVAMLLLAAALLTAASAWARPAALAAVTAFYGLYIAVLVIGEARLQDRITGPHRATITSVAGLGIELSALLAFAAWALGGTWGLAALVVAVVPVVAAGLHRRPAPIRLTET